jgi:hypothetical protein
VLLISGGFVDLTVAWATVAGATVRRVQGFIKAVCYSSKER